METSELTLLDLQDLLESLKRHVRSEVEKYVDKRVEEVKDEAVTYIINKVLNNMVGNEPLNELKIDKRKCMKLQSVMRESLFTMGKNIVLLLRLAQELPVKVATVGIFLKYALTPKKN